MAFEPETLASRSKYQRSRIVA